jgi:hypothetical protein
MFQTNLFWFLPKEIVKGIHNMLFYDLPKNNKKNEENPGS